MKTLRDIFYKIKTNKDVRLYLLIGLGVISLIVASFFGVINIPMNESKIAKNAEITNMFQQSTRSEEHQRDAEKNWATKYFNINF